MHSQVAIIRQGAGSRRSTTCTPAWAAGCKRPTSLCGVRWRSTAELATKIRRDRCIDRSSRSRRWVAVRPRICDPAEAAAASRQWRPQGRSIAVHLPAPREPQGGCRTSRQAGCLRRTCRARVPGAPPPAPALGMSPMHSLLARRERISCTNWALQGVRGQGGRGLRRIGPHQQLAAAGSVQHTQGEAAHDEDMQRVAVEAVQPRQYRRGQNEHRQSVRTPPCRRARAVTTSRQHCE